jgi:hypothetical protein
MGFIASHYRYMCILNIKQLFFLPFLQLQSTIYDIPSTQPVTQKNSPSKKRKVYRRVRVNRCTDSSDSEDSASIETGANSQCHGSLKKPLKSASKSADSFVIKEGVAKWLNRGRSVRADRLCLSKGGSVQQKRANRRVIRSSSESDAIEVSQRDVTNGSSGSIISVTDSCLSMTDVGVDTQDVVDKNSTDSSYFEASQQSVTDDEVYTQTPGIIIEPIVSTDDDFFDKAKTTVRYTEMYTDMRETSEDEIDTPLVDTPLAQRHPNMVKALGHSVTTQARKVSTSRVTAMDDELPFIQHTKRRLRDELAGSSTTVIPPHTPSGRPVPKKSSKLAVLQTTPQATPTVSITLKFNNCIILLCY